MQVEREIIPLETIQRQNPILSSVPVLPSLVDFLGTGLSLSLQGGFLMCPVLLPSSKERG